jgi:lipoprotein-anchoring transpeptidase ErfK/SrfK
MRKGSLIFASVIGFAIAFSGAAGAQSLLDPSVLQPGAAVPAAAGPAVGPQARLGGQPLYPEMVSRARVVPSQYRRQTVRYQTDERPGTIIVDSRQFYLYLVLGNGQAMRYGVGVGRQGFGWKGAVTVARKAEWPAWHPPKDMIARERARGHILPARMEGGPNNPLGARALYLHDSRGRDTLYRIHGTSEPWTIGLNVSSGCIRLVNDDIIDLHRRVGIGAKVIVI